MSPAFPNPVPYPLRALPRWQPQAVRRRRNLNRWRAARRERAKARRVVHLTYGEPVGSRGFFASDPNGGRMHVSVVDGFRTACGRVYADYGDQMVDLGDEARVTCPACLRDWALAKEEARAGIDLSETPTDLAMRTTSGTGRSPRRKWGI